MPELSAAITSSLAQDVYALSKFVKLSDAMEELNRAHGKFFEFADTYVLNARTGGPAGIKISSAFGFVLVGKGALKGHAVILFRGTVSAADWLTNLNCTTSTTEAGLSVHDGFRQAFESMKGRISTFLNTVNRKSSIKSIHCIGHSLGGALATLCASWIKNGQNKSTYLYTFGSPKVGLEAFAKDLTTRMSSDRIFRVYHKTDPVPVVPTWPYVHVPNSGTDYLLYSAGGFFTAKYHFMEHYCETIDGKNWGAMKGLREAPKDDESIIRWLKSKIKAAFNFDNVHNLNDALLLILKRCGYIIPATITSGFALIDGIAYVLKKGLGLLTAVSKLVLLFIKKLMELLGVVREVEAELFSKAFIRELLMRLHQKVAIEAEKALRLGLA